MMLKEMTRRARKLTRNPVPKSYWIWGGVVAAVGTAFVLASQISFAKPNAAGSTPTPPPQPKGTYVNLTLAPGTMAPVRLPASFGSNLDISVPGTQGGSITGLSTPSGYLLGDNVAGPETKQTGTPTSGNTSFGWNFNPAWANTSGLLTVVWYDANGVAQQTQIPITLI